MEEKIVKKKRFDGTEVDVLEGDYEEGVPSEADRWRAKTRDRDEMLKYIKTGLRYYYDKEGFGSEKRKTPA